MDTSKVQPPWLTPPVDSSPPKAWVAGMPSPNPKGRPRGIVDKRMKMTKALMGDASKILEVLKAAALNGDMQAIGLVMQRVMPPIKARADRVAFEFDADASLTDQARQILLAIAAGEVDPDTGKMLMECLSTLQGIHQVDELAKRMAEIEAALLGRQQ